MPRRLNSNSSYDKPYEDKKKVCVAGPFTVKSLSPHRALTVDEHDELVDGVAETGSEYNEALSFPELILKNLRTGGVQQAHKEDRITFTSLVPWPGEGRVCDEGRYMENASKIASPTGKGKKVADRPDQGVGIERRAGIFIGPEFATVQRAEQVEAAWQSLHSDTSRPFDEPSSGRIAVKVINHPGG